LAVYHTVVSEEGGCGVGRFKDMYPWAYLPTVSICVSCDAPSAHREAPKSALLGLLMVATRRIGSAAPLKCTLGNNCELSGSSFREVGNLTTPVGGINVRIGAQA
jgi:hypothetical protein